jgi:hypothetical protein
VAARYAIIQTPQFTDQVAALSDAQRDELARLYETLMVAPLPGQSVLSVTPYPYIPGGYVVPFVDGLIVYVVQPRRRVIGMLDMIGVEPG